MIVDYENKRYVFEFEHELFEEPTELPFREGMPLSGVTQCHLTIFSRARLPVNYTAPSWCSYQDVFSRAVGRKISLTRSLKMFSKDFRTLVWGLYWNTHKKDHNDSRFIPKEKKNNEKD